MSLKITIALFPSIKLYQIRHFLSNSPAFKYAHNSCCNKKKPEAHQASGFAFFSS